MTPTPSPKPRNELTTRIVVGVVLIGVALLALILGDAPFWLLTAIAGILMQAEWADLLHAKPHHKRLSLFSLVFPLAIMSPFAAGPAFLAIGFILGAVAAVALITRNAKLAAGIIYSALPILALIFLRERPDGLVLTLWAMALVWATDIGAFFVGRQFGGPKLAPRVSPSKTWSGLIGGIMFSLIFGLAMHHFAGLPAVLAAASGLLAILAQAGDLFESWLKRRAGVKDSGNILPGHGGVMDRLDGLVPVAPVVALILLASSGS